MNRAKSQQEKTIIELLCTIKLISHAMLAYLAGRAAIRIAGYIVYQARYLLTVLNLR
jgi:hypothetical protein